MPAAMRCSPGSRSSPTSPSAAVSLPEHYAAALRTGTPAVVGRIEDGRCLLDLRTVAPEDDDALLRAVLACTS